MSVILATERLPGEAETTEGRIADIIEMDDSEIWIDTYRLSEADRDKVIFALRRAAMF